MTLGRSKTGGGEAGRVPQPLGMWAREQGTPEAGRLVTDSGLPQVQRKMAQCKGTASWKVQTGNVVSGGLARLYSLPQAALLTPNSLGLEGDGWVDRWVGGWMDTHTHTHVHTHAHTHAHMHAQCTEPECLILHKGGAHVCQPGRLQISRTTSSSAFLLVVLLLLSHSLKFTQLCQVCVHFHL